MFRYLYVYFVAKLYYTANKFGFNYVYVKASILNTFILFNCMLWFVLHIWRNKTKLLKKKKKCYVCAGEKDEGVFIYLVCRHFNRMDSESDMSYIISIANIRNKLLFPGRKSYTQTHQKREHFQ